jgi:hypothetical protein
VVEVDEVDVEVLGVVVLVTGGAVVGARVGGVRAAEIGGVVSTV